MDGNSSLERRYSFNMGQGIPVAESTHLNGSNFCWGSSMSPKHRSNSSLSLNNTNTSADNNKSIVSPKSRNVTKIDARIAADVQSKGLASRIVKYHESGTRLNRSMSAHNLYNKPGQFPVVTLRKTELPYRATKQELSMIRIPPPEKSSFYGNTISSLLRSNSVVGLQPKRTEDLSRENRPIIHPPPSENDMAPTRSVLDVLKEISRKRINSDGLEQDETSKKYCNRPGSNDFVDTGINTSAIQPKFLSTSVACQQRYKRQRECITPHQSAQLFETKKSPEQAKKRVCNYNNDITSSLSSSIKCKLDDNSKRVFNHNLNQTMPANLESYVTQKSKMQRYNDHNNKNNSRLDVRYENLENSLRKVDLIKPITPIPVTPCVQDQSNISAALPMRTVSEPIFNADGKNMVHSIETSCKPRLTLFNKKYDDDENTGASESVKSVRESNSDFNDFDECAGIPFVKPKKISTKSGLRNPFIERTQKSKLALMLSGLKGELYQNSDTDELDSLKPKSTRTEDNTLIINAKAVVSASKSTAPITTLTTVTSSTNAGMPKASCKAGITAAVKTSSTLITNVTPNKTSSPLVGLKLSQPIPSNENVASTLSVDATKIPETLPKANLPVLGGFSFGITTTSTSSNIPKDSKTSTTSIATLSTSGNDVTKFSQSSQLISTSTSDNTIKLSANNQTATKENSLILAHVSSAFTLPSNNTSTPLNTTNSFTAVNTFALGTKGSAPASTSSTSTLNTGTVLFNSTGKSSNAFNFSLPSTSPTSTSSSSMPIMFDTLTTSVVTGSSSCIVTATTSTPTFGAVNSSANMMGLSSTSLKFSSEKQSSPSETKTSSSINGVSSVSFNFGSNNAAPSVSTFGTNTNTEIKPQPTIKSAFSFGSDTKIKNSSEQNKTSATNQTENNSFGSNPTTLFGSSSFNAPATIGSVPMFANASSNSEKNIFNSSNGTSIFGSSSAKASNQTFGSSTDNKSSVFGGSSTNNSNSAPTSFSFGSKPTIVPASNSNNTNTRSEGFSFGSAVGSSSDGGKFAFGSKPSESTNNSSITFGSASTGAQNQNFTFGISNSKPENSQSLFGGAVNKPENTSAGGFSFGSSMAPKTSTFSFGSGGNISFSGNNANNNNSTAGFSFAGTVAPKPSEISINKPFSFGSSQPPQQQQPQQILPAPSSNTSSSNIFGSSCAAKTSTPPAFNFNSGSSINLQTNAPTTNNIFAPPPTTIASGPGERQIRRATRRLQK